MPCGHSGWHVLCVRPGDNFSWNKYQSVSCLLVPILPGGDAAESSSLEVSATSPLDDYLDSLSGPEESPSSPFLEVSTTQLPLL